MSSLRRLSQKIARIETIIGATLGAMIMGLILLNVITRSLGNALYWVDEAAISAMVWMAFLGASVAIHHRDTVAVTFVPDLLSPNLAAALSWFVDLLVLAFCIVLAALCWRWFDPLVLAQNKFDTKAFSSVTFNFIYAETTTTLGFQKFWLWLIVPLFSFSGSIHALSNLIHRPNISKNMPSDRA